MLRRSIVEIVFCVLSGIFSLINTQTHNTHPRTESIIQQLDRTPSSPTSSSRTTHIEQPQARTKRIHCAGRSLLSPSVFIAAISFGVHRCSTSTISSELGGAPFGNVVSYSDGKPGKGTGIPYFYLTTLDPTARNALKDQRASLTISEYPIGTCGNKDPENLTCAKITLTGKLKVAKGDPKELEFAKNALFSKHPEMKDWPKGHNFEIFKLDIENIFLINWFGGPKPLTVDQYLQAKLTGQTFVRGSII